MSNAATSSSAKRNRSTHRRIVERIVIEGVLQLETPANFGNGDSDAFTDIPLLMDELENCPLLTGASIAGALRNYLREREVGDCKRPPLPPSKQNSAEERKLERERFAAEKKHERNLIATLLFGAYRGDDEGEQSPLIIEDALGKATEYELRDGVKIDAKTRTAEDEKKFDMQLLAAGTTFDLRFELLVCVPDGKETNDQAAIESHKQELLKALVTALSGLEKGEIALGTRKRRGFGRCKVEEWSVRRYELEKREDILAWLAQGRGNQNEMWTNVVEAKTAASISDAIEKATGIKVAEIDDNRKRLVINATFEIDGSLMVRAGLPDVGADMVHLHSLRTGGKRPIFAGTSWAGVLRSRAEKIANTLATDRERAKEIIERMFGPSEIEGNRDNPKPKREAKASRVEVAETVIEGAKLLEQTRVKIDRFTGGAFESALFSEQPVFGGSGSVLSLDLLLRLPEVETDKNKNEQESEIGLLLLLLKDLWTGNLPVGGEVSIGRGRLKGMRAEMSLGKGEKWILVRKGEGLEIKGSKERLNDFVKSLGKELRNG